jgi:glutathione S-transferase
MITIYHLSVSQSDRIVWLMEELGLPYKLEWFDRLPNRFAPPAYKALHPVATSPTIRDGDKVICESVAIILYIVNRYGNGRLSVPVDAPNYADYLYWLCVGSSVMGTMGQLAASDPSLRNKVGAEADITSPDAVRAVFAKSAIERMDAYFNHFEMRLGESAYLAGPEFTAADIQNMFALDAMPKLGGPSVAHLKHVCAYVERVAARPAYRKAMAIAGLEAVRPI